MTTRYKCEMRMNTARKKAVQKAKENGYGPAIIDRIINARSSYDIKQALITGMNEFRTYKREAIVAVKDFGYGDDILEQVKNAKTMRDITIIMNEARKHFDFETNESVEAYDQRIGKEAKCGKIR